MGAFFAAGAAGASFAEGVSRSRRQAGAQAGLPALQGGVVGAARAQTGFGPLLPAASRLLECGRVRACVQEAAWAMSEGGRATTPKALLSLWLLAALLLAGAAGVASASPVAACAVAACAAAVWMAVLKTAQDRRRAAVREAVPDALRAMGVCFQSGLSLLQTFQQVAKETQPPLQALFLRASHLLQTGRTASEALSVFRSGPLVSELAFVAVALDVQHQTGGSIGQVLESARETVESELDLERSLRVQTAQARLSARIVSVMPFCAGGHILSGER